MNKQNLNFSKLTIILSFMIIFITIISTYMVYKQNTDKQLILFNNIANKVPSSIENRLKIYNQVLLSGVALFYSSEYVSRQEWKKFISEIKIEENYPGIQGIGYSILVKPENLQTLVNKVKSEGFPNFDIKPKGKRDIYTSIIYLEPFDARNQRAFGYDMFSQETRREGMKNAINTGQYSLSGKVHLLQENGNDVQAGFLAYIPVYKPNMPMNNYEEKLEATLGFVYAPFRVKDLITSIELDEGNYLYLEIYDNNISEIENLIYKSNYTEKEYNKDIELVKTITLGGRDWLIKIHPKNIFIDSTKYNTHYGVLLTGLVLIIAVLVLSYIYKKFEKRKDSYYHEIKALALRKNIVLKAATIGTWELNFEDDTIKWDDNMYHIYELDNKLLNKDLSNAWKELIHKDYKTAVLNELIEAKKEKRELNISFWIITKNGNEKFIHSLGVIEFDNNNKPIRIIGINHDITDYESIKLRLLEQKDLVTEQKSKFEAMVKHSKDAIAIIDLDTNFLFFNNACEEITGYSKDILLKVGIKQLVDMRDIDVFEDMVEQTIKYGFVETSNKISFVKHGIRVYLDITMVLLPDQKRILFTAKDVTQATKKEKLINDYIELVDKNVITSSTDLKGVITNVSEAFCKITGYAKDEIIGSTHSVLRHKDTADSFYTEMWEVLKSDKTWEGEIQNRRKDGSSYWVKATISPIYNDENQKIGYTAIREDITDKKLIEKLSITDALTDLYNRRHFNNTFSNFIHSAKRHNELVCFIILDVDHFKQYNDTYGHQKGDEVLIIIAKVLKNSLHRVDDYCFRLGGEEFGVLFKAQTSQNAKEFTETIRANIENQKIIHEYNSASKYVTASFGLICLHANEIENIDNVYKSADDLLYVAKDTGRNKLACNC